LEGKVGDHPGVSSGVLGVISFLGASNLQTILGQSTEFGLGMRIPALQLLLSGQPKERPQLAALASPVAHVDPTDPPVLMFHGDEDPQMPFAQSEELLERCVKVGVAAKLHVVRGGKHGGPGFYDAAQMRLVREFLAEAFKAPLDRPAKR
jgi:acetyl esterase/lipase